MTTPEAARRYEAEHITRWEGKGYAVYNPKNRPIEELPMIYGFNNGGRSDSLQAQLLSEDGVGLGSHCCSSEGYMPSDLGVLEGSRPDRHEGFKKHYPSGYRMDFVRYDEIDDHTGLLKALEIAKSRQAQKEKEESNNE